MNGQKERLMVLDMIAEGKITAEEAEQLFKAMDVTEDVPTSGSPALAPHPYQLSSSSLPSIVDQPADRRRPKGAGMSHDCQRRAGVPKQQDHRGIHA